jgi:hypothetical protein
VNQTQSGLLIVKEYVAMYERLKKYINKLPGGSASADIIIKNKMNNSRKRKKPSKPVDT